MDKKLYLIAGANGSGKTTLAHELLLEEKDLVFLNADEVSAKIGDSIGISSGKIVLAEISRMLDSHKSFVLESTISGSHHLRVLKAAKERGYEVNLIYVFLDAPGLNIARVKYRVQIGGHNVPQADIIRRFHKSIKNFWITAELADVWKLYYNGGDDYEEIAAARGNNTTIFNNDIYKKFNEWIENV
ncbi:MAG: zeta toxin family protein [Chitinispirillales bacterium]|jgi:predicted ABC-type ATPase|nr:zeta toxin family protein [Chitinispirillales bacterium]